MLVRKSLWLQNREVIEKKTRRGSGDYNNQGGEGQTDYEYINEMRFTGQKDLF